jgi:hypothetical protein
VGGLIFTFNDGKVVHACRIAWSGYGLYRSCHLDYRNDHGKFVESFRNIVNWDEVGQR